MGEKGSGFRLGIRAITVLGTVLAVVSVVGLTSDLVSLGLFILPTTPTATPTTTPTATPTTTPTTTPTATPFGTPTATPFGTPTATPLGAAVAEIAALQGTIDALEVEATVAQAERKTEVEKARYSAFATAVASTEGSRQPANRFSVAEVGAFGGVVIAVGGLYLQWREDKREQEAHEERSRADDE